ncbi:MAG: phosphoadenylyl-sulfate reductase [Candidatus Thermoplasmatota archaeon]|jgi:phosphoadenosine phosphosulfate reductase|nr:phosphoadenylyl-sulfate reductase [Candidatus Thermoplasmatota archaeon]MCL5984394.1 phosphoadenylyl-sulfate reductase [Candidatus Thermoplasmatota archaeon]
MSPSTEELASLESRTAEEIVLWAAEKFGTKVALSTSYGAEDMVLMDMVKKVAPSMRVFTLDTGRLPEETYRLMSLARTRYALPVAVYFPDTSRVQEMVNTHGVNLFYDSVDSRKLCCQVRKVEPLGRAMNGLGAWVTGLRREQSTARAAVRKVEFDEGRPGVMKICPLADWTEEMVWDYIKKWDVPYNELHDKNYPSIGCAPCTRAIQPGEDKRAGRWWWESSSKECGLHEHAAKATAKP